MIAVLVSLALAAAAWWCGPRLLTVGRWQVRYPRMALAAWHSALLVGVLAVFASIGAAVAVTLSVSHVSDVMAAAVQTIAGWGALGVLGALVAVIAGGSDELVGAGRRTYGDVLSLPHSLTRLDGRTMLRTCRSEEPFACAIPGRDAAVVITTGLREILTPAQVAAVIAHERAHLRGRHYVAVRLAELNRACLPSSRAGKQLLRATALLVELIADDDAARSAGAVHLANALVQIAPHAQGVSMELRAERLADRRWVPARKLAAAELAVQY